MNAYLKS
jgi:hypothetical protein